MTNKPEKKLKSMFSNNLDNLDLKQLKIKLDLLEKRVILLEKVLKREPIK